MTLNPWQRKAQERWPFGVWRTSDSGGWIRLHDSEQASEMLTSPSKRPDCDILPLPTILLRLAYERQECGICRGSKANHYAEGARSWWQDCPACRDEVGKPTGTSPDYRKAQEWAERLGLEDG